MTMDSDHLLQVWLTERLKATQDEVESEVLLSMAMAGNNHLHARLELDDRHTLVKIYDANTLLETSSVMIPASAKCYIWNGEEGVILDDDVLSFVNVKTAQIGQKLIGSVDSVWPVPLVIDDQVHIAMICNQETSLVLLGVGDQSVQEPVTPEGFKMHQLEVCEDGSTGVCALKNTKALCVWNITEGVVKLLIPQGEDRR